jgi:hypothetical protein
MLRHFKWEESWQSESVTPKRKIRTKHVVDLVQNILNYVMLSSFVTRIKILVIIFVRMQVLLINIIVLSPKFSFLCLRWLFSILFSAIHTFIVGGHYVNTNRWVVFALTMLHLDK